MKRYYKSKLLLAVVALLGMCRVSDVMGAGLLSEVGSKLLRRATVGGASDAAKQAARNASKSINSSVTKSSVEMATQKTPINQLKAEPGSVADDLNKILQQRPVASAFKADSNFVKSVDNGTTADASKTLNLADDAASASRLSSSSTDSALAKNVEGNGGRGFESSTDDLTTQANKQVDGWVDPKFRNLKIDTPNPLGVGRNTKFDQAHIEMKASVQKSEAAEKIAQKQLTKDVTEEGGQVFARTGGNLDQIGFKPGQGANQEILNAALKDAKFGGTSGNRFVEDGGNILLKDAKDNTLGTFTGFKGNVKGGSKELTPAQNAAITKKILEDNIGHIKVNIKGGYAEAGIQKAVGNKYSTLLRAETKNLSVEGRVALKQEADALIKKEIKLAPATRKVGRFFKKLSLPGVEWLVKKLIIGTGILLITSIAFSVPNTIFQMQQEKEQRNALYETVGAPQPFGKLWLQIPPRLVLHGDASQSKFIYLEIPDHVKRKEGYFTDEVLNEGKYYVPYLGEYQDWATTYLGGAGFGGSMVSLKTGWLFTGNGISVDDMRPTFPLRPRGTRATQSSTVEAFLNQTVATAGQKETVHWTTAMDWLFGAVSDNVSHVKVDDERIKNLFATPDPIASSLADATGFTPLPPLFYGTSAAFRQPRTLDYFGGIMLRQMQGTGFLNRLLSVDIDWNAPESQPLYDKVKKLNDAQIAYNRAALGGYKSKAELESCSKQLQAAQNDIASLNSMQLGGSGGLHPQEDLSMYGCYIYEIVADQNGALTPSLDFLLRTKPCTGIPITEYVVCLDAAGNNIPLIVPRVVEKAPSPDEVVSQPTSSSKTTTEPASKRYTVDYVVNPRIAYLTSLTTGLTYTSNNTGMLGAPLMQKDKITPDFTFASRACTAIMGKLYEISQKGSPVMGALSQIVAMSNYVAKAATAGPFKLENGYQLERVPLAAMFDDETSLNSKSAEDANLKSMSNILAGITDWVRPNIEIPDANRSEWLKYMNVYKVSMPGCNGVGTVGALSYVGTDGKLVDIPDYVIAVAKSTDTPSQTILPLGLNNITGSSVASNTQYIMSLVTGRVYDINYNSYAPFMKALEVVDRTYTTYPAQNITQQLNINVAAKPGWKTKTFSLPSPDTGKLEPYTLPYTEAPLATAYMPTAFNPYNRIFQNNQDKVAYEGIIAAVKDANDKKALAAAKVNTALGFKASSVISGAIFDTYRTAVTQNKDFATLFSETFTGATQQMGETLLSALNEYFDATKQYYALWDTYMNMQAKIDSGTIPTSARGITSQLYIPPLYFGLFSQFSVVDKGGFTLQSVPADASGKQDDNLTWVNTQVTSSAKPIALFDDYGKVQSWIPLLEMLPKKFVGYDLSTASDDKDITYYPGSAQFPSLLNVYSAWEASQSSTYWATNVYMGPFNFTGAALAESDRKNLSNVFITPTSRADVANRNYFYRATGFDQADIFVLGRAVNPDKPVKSLADLKDVGKPFIAPGGKDYYMINIGTGYVYTPYAGQSESGATSADNPTPIEDPSRCIYTHDGAGNPVNEVVSGVASTQKWWSLVQAGKEITVGESKWIAPLRLDPAQVIQAVLKNTIVKGRPATMADLTPTLRGLIGSVQTVNGQIMQQNLYPFYFNNQFTLALRQDQIDNGSYVYAVVNKGETYLNGSDYLVTCLIDDKGDIQIIPSPLRDYTTTMISLVSGTMYDMDLGTLREAYTTDSFTDPETGTLPAGYPRGNTDIDVSEVAQNIAAQIPQLAPDLLGAIGNLNQQYLDSKARSLSAQPDVNATPLDITKLTPVATDESSPYSDLYQMAVNGKTKYFVKATVPAIVPGADGITPTSVDIDTYFDFKATPIFTDKDQASDYGVLYYVDPKTKKATAKSITVGYELQAIRLHNGVNVASDGTQRLGIPLASISLPKGDKENALVPKVGENGVYMRCLTNFGVVDDATHNASYTYYQNTAINSAFVAVQDKGLKITDPKFNKDASGKVITQTITDPDKFVDLTTGDAYDIAGVPQREKVTMAFKHLRPRQSIFTYSGVKAAALPLDALKSATPDRMGLCSVNGKYYLKVISRTPVVDKNGQVQNDSVTGAQRIESTTRYFDFNASRTEVAPKTDTGMGIWYQVAKDATGKEIAVPIDDTWQDDQNNLDGRYLTDTRAYYGVRVASDGTQRLLDPVIMGVDCQRILFVWGDKSIFEDEFNVHAMYHDGSNYDFYTYVPLSRSYGFTNADGSALYEYGYSPESTEDSVKIQCITTLNDTRKVENLNVKTLEDALQSAIQSGQLLYAITYTLESGTDDIVVTESAMNPRVFTIADDANEYLEIIRTTNYQTAWAQEGPGKKTEAQIATEVANREFSGDLFAQGIPFVAQSIGSRVSGSQDELDPAITTPYIAGIMNEKGGLLAFTSDLVIQDGITSTQLFYAPKSALQSMIAPGKPIAYYSLFGASYPVYGQTSNYPVIENPESGQPINQGLYLAITRQGIVYNGNGKVDVNDYLYRFSQESVSDSQLEAMQSMVNVVSTANGSSSVAGAFNVSDFRGISLDGMPNNIGYITTPEKRLLYVVPSDTAMQQLYANDKRVFYDLQNNPISAYENYKLAFADYPAGTYIDYTDGVVFMPSATDSKVLYPIGVAASLDVLRIIHEQFSNGVAYTGGDKPVLLSPEQYYNLTKTLTPKDSISSADTSGSTTPTNNVNPVVTTPTTAGNVTAAPTAKVAAPVRVIKAR